MILIHPEIVAQFVDDRQADLFADFGLAGADCLLLPESVQRRIIVVKRGAAPT